MTSSPGRKFVEKTLAIAHWPTLILEREGHIRTFLRALKLEDSPYSDNFYFPNSNKLKPHCLHCCLIWLIDKRKYKINWGIPEFYVFYCTTPAKKSAHVQCTAIDGQPMLSLCEAPKDTNQVLTTWAALNFPVDAPAQVVLGSQVPLTVTSIPFASLTKEQLQDCTFYIFDAAVVEWGRHSLKQESLHGIIGVRRPDQ